MVAWATRGNPQGLHKSNKPGQWRRFLTSKAAADFDAEARRKGAYGSFALTTGKGVSLASVPTFTARVVGPRDASIRIQVRLVTRLSLAGKQQQATAFSVIHYLMKNVDGRWLVDGWRTDKFEFA